MASNRLTWRDVTAPDYGSTMQGAEAANRMFQEALRGLSTSLGSFTNKRQEAHEGDFLRELAAVSGDTEQEAALRRSLSGNRRVSNEFIGKQLTDFRNSQIAGNTAAENLQQIIKNNLRTNRDNELVDGFRPTAGSMAAHVSGGGGDPFSAMSDEQRAAYDALPLQVQRDLLSSWSGEQTSNLGRASTRQSMDHAATRFSNDLDDREVNQTARELAYGARKAGMDSADQAAFITANAPNALIAAAAMQLLPGTTTATGESPGGGGSRSGGAGGSGSGGGGSPDGSSGLPTDAERERALINLDIQSRINQENALANTDDLTRLESDKTPEYAVAEQLIAEGGAFPGADRGLVVRDLQKIMREHGINAAQAGNILSRNTRPETIWDRVSPYIPHVAAYRAISGERPVSGGGLQVNEEGVKASSGMVGSKAYQDQRTAQAERADVIRLVNTLSEQSRVAQERAQEAQRFQRATGGSYDPTAELEAVEAINTQLEQVLRGIEGEDARLGRLVVDPDNPGQFTTTGDLRNRGLERQADEVRREIGKEEEDLKREIDKEEAKARLPEVRELEEFLSKEQDWTRRSGRRDTELERRLRDTRILLRELETLAK